MSDQSYETLECYRHHVENLSSSANIETTLLLFECEHGMAKWNSLPNINNDAFHNQYELQFVSDTNNGVGSHAPML